MKRIFVAGGAGGVGEGIVRAWLGRGARVVVPSRSAARLEALRGEVEGLSGELVTVEGAPQDPSLVEQLAEAHGPFDQVCASVGGDGWALAPLQRIEEPALRRVIEDGIVAHWAIARQWRPRLRSGGSYVFINGGAAREVVPGTGPLSLAARAQLALAAIFDAEEDRDVRTTSLILNTPISTRSRGRTEPAWLSPDDVGDACVALEAMDAPAEVTLHGRADVDGLGGSRP